MLHTRGNDALLRENFDYAIDLFTQILTREPAVYECRKGLRSAQLRKAGTGKGMFKKFLSNAGSSPMVARAQMAMRKDPAEALQLAEQVLNSDPENAPAHRVIVEAASALEYPRTAVMSLEILMKISPKDRDIAIKFATALADGGEVGRAEKILVDLHDSYPDDPELTSALKNISARKTMDKGGYEALAQGTGSYRDILKNKEEASSLEQQNRQVKSEDTAERLIKEYEARLVTEPKNLKLMRDLAELHTQKKQFDKALAYYNRIKASEGMSDSGLERGLAETTMRKFDHEIAQLDATVPDYTEQVSRLQSEKQAYQLDECQKRAERFPTDLQIRYDLGLLYFNLGKIGEATKEFQKAQANPQRRLSSMNYLAQCFAKRRMFDLAARTLENAIKEKPVFDEEKKDLVYNYGTVLEAMGKKAEAIEQYKLIYEVDLSYRDVEKKVDDFYSSQG